MSGGGICGSSSGGIVDNGNEDARSGSDLDFMDLIYKRGDDYSKILSIFDREQGRFPCVDWEMEGLVDEIHEENCRNSLQRALGDMEACLRRNIFGDKVFLSPTAKKEEVYSRPVEDRYTALLEIKEVRAFPREFKANQFMGAAYPQKHPMRPSIFAMGGACSTKELDYVLKKYSDARSVDKFRDWGMPPLFKNKTAFNPLAYAIDKAQTEYWNKASDLIEKRSRDLLEDLCCYILLLQGVSSGNQWGEADFNQKEHGLHGAVVGKEHGPTINVLITFQGFPIIEPMKDLSDIKKISLSQPVVLKIWMDHLAVPLMMGEDGAEVLSLVQKMYFGGLTDKNTAKICLRIINTAYDKTPEVIGTQVKDWMCNILTRILSGELDACFFEEVSGQWRVFEKKGRVAKPDTVGDTDDVQPPLKKQKTLEEEGAAADEDEDEWPGSLRIASPAYCYDRD